MRKILAAVALPLALLLTLVTAASFLGAWWWVPALIVHFRPHLVAASLVLFALGAIARRPAICIVGLALLAVNGTPVLPYIAGGAHAATAGNLRILELNMHGAGTNREGFRQMVTAQHPDLVMLTEMPGNLERVAREVPDLPPYRIGSLPTSPWAVGLFSRWPVMRWSVDRGADGTARVVSADICDTPEWKGCLRLVALHAPRPFGDGARRQEDQLEIAATLAVSAPDHRAIVLGDLNLTPWAPAFSRLVAEGDLRDTGPYRGLLATWLSRVPFVGLLIDQVLVSPSIGILANRLGPDVGSDHLPVIVDLAVPAQP
jgi:endonuclease/exonuclease/phosphatase (EEP) superfamily protein YafD